MDSRVERTKKQKRKRRIIKSTLLLIFFAIIIPIFILPGCSKLTEIISGTPELDLSAIENQSEASFFYDINGDVITEYFSSENRTWADIDEIPLQIRQAFIAIEDKRFYKHFGVDPIRIAGSLVNNIKGGATQGGSTLTQQLIKLVYLTQEQTYARKIQEALLSLRLERVYSKDEILEAYLNTIYLAQGNYGLKAASLDYFGHQNLYDLTLRQCAMMACIANRPNYYDPRKAQYQNPEAWTDLNERIDLILKLMLEQEYISQTQYETAINETLEIQENAIRLQLYDHAPYMDYAIKEVLNELIIANNWSGLEDAESKAELLLYTGGFRITTAMDPTTQTVAENTLYNWESYAKIPNTENEYAQACTAIIDNRTGYLSAIVGSRTRSTAKRELNRASESYLMPGSSIKPLAVYGPALDAGASVTNVYANIPVHIEGWDPQQSFPQNYRNSGYTGPTTMRQGLIKSINTVAARCLVNDVSFENSLNYLVSMNFNPTHINMSGSDLALGTCTTTAVTMASGYATIANYGKYRSPKSVLKIIDKSGKTLVDHTINPKETIVYKESTAWLLISMMQDAVARGTGTNAQVENMTVAGKTGTGSDNKSTYFCGITPYYSAAVWVGADSNASLGSSATGGKYAAPIFSAMMAELHKQKELSNKAILDATPQSLGLEEKTICGASGLLIGPNCPKDRAITDWFVPGTAPTVTCPHHASANLCTTSYKYPTKFCPEETQEIVSFYVLPQDSIYRWLSESELKLYFPEAATKEQENMLANMQANPPREQDYCHVHLPSLDNPNPSDPDNPLQPPAPSDFFGNIDKWFDLLFPPQGTAPTPEPVITPIVTPIAPIEISPTPTPIPPEPIQTPQP